MYAHERRFMESGRSNFRFGESDRGQNHELNTERTHSKSRQLQASDDDEEEQDVPSRSTPPHLSRNRVLRPRRPPTEPKEKSINQWIIISVIVFVIILIAAGWFLYQRICKVENSTSEDIGKIKNDVEAHQHIQSETVQKQREQLERNVSDMLATQHSSSGGNGYVSNEEFLKVMEATYRLIGDLRSEIDQLHNQLSEVQVYSNEDENK